MIVSFDFMNLESIEHIIRAVGSAMEESDVYIIGSNSIFAWFNLEKVLNEGVSEQQKNDIMLLSTSQDVDVILAHNPEKSEDVSGALGQDSPFHIEYGYYVDGVDFATATLPANWKERCRILQSENTNQVRGHVIDVHDLVVSKLVAGRPKDLEYIEAAFRMSLINQSILIERLSLTELESGVREITENRLERLHKSTRFV